MLNYPLDLVNSNPNYLIAIFGSDERGFDIASGADKNSANIPATPSLGILSPMPEDFTVSTSADWHPLLDGILHSLASTFVHGTNAGQLALSIGESVGQARGYGQSTKLSQLVWQSTSPVIFNLPLKFNAVKDANKEVTTPILNLLKLTLPSNLDTGGGVDLNNLTNALFTRAPGPTLVGSNKYNVSIAIGNMFIFTNVIIRSVSAVFNTLATAGGDFISADVQLEVSTSKILTKSDLDKVFKLRNQFGSYGGLPELQNASIPTPDLANSPAAPVANSAPSPSVVNSPIPTLPNSSIPTLFVHPTPNERPPFVSPLGNRVLTTIPGNN